MIFGRMIAVLVAMAVLYAGEILTGVAFYIARWRWANWMVLMQNWKW